MAGSLPLRTPSACHGLHGVRRWAERAGLLSMVVPRAWQGEEERAARTEAGGQGHWGGKPRSATSSPSPGDRDLPRWS